MISASTLLFSFRYHETIFILIIVDTRTVNRLKPVLQYYVHEYAFEINL